MGEGDERAAVLGPAFQDRQRGEIKGGFFALIEADDDFLAGTGADVRGASVDDVEAFAQERPGFGERARRLGLEEKGDLVGDFVNVIDLEGERHPFLRAKGVDQDGEGGDLSIRQKRFFDEERLAAGRGFHLAIGERGDFELGADGLRDANQFTAGFQLVGEFAHGGKGHVAKLSIN